MGIVLSQQLSRRHGADKPFNNFANVGLRNHHAHGKSHRQQIHQLTQVVSPAKIDRQQPRIGQFFRPLQAFGHRVRFVAKHGR